MSFRPVVVVGAGVSGLLSALSASVAGHDVIIIDRSLTAQDARRRACSAGATLLHSRAVSLLPSIGILPNSLQGHWVSGIRLNKSATYKTPVLCLRVAQLHSALQSAVDSRVADGKSTGKQSSNNVASITFKWGTTFLGFANEADGRVAVHLKGGQGAETVRAGALVGADGSGSAVRTAITGHTDAPFDTACDVWTGTASLGADCEGTIAQALRTETSDGVYVCSLVPLGDGEVGWIAIGPRSDAREAELEASGVPIIASPPQVGLSYDAHIALLQSFSGKLPDIVGRVIGGADYSTITVSPLIGRSPLLSPPVSGVALLVGTARHGTGAPSSLDLLASCAVEEAVSVGAALGAWRSGMDFLASSTSADASVERAAPPPTSLKEVFSQGWTAIKSFWEDTSREPDEDRAFMKKRREETFRSVMKSLHWWHLAPATSALYFDAGTGRDPLRGALQTSESEASWSGGDTTDGSDKLSAVLGYLGDTGGFARPSLDTEPEAPPATIAAANGLPSAGAALWLHYGYPRRSETLRPRLPSVTLLHGTMQALGKITSPRYTAMVLQMLTKCFRTADGTRCDMPYMSTFSYILSQSLSTSASSPSPATLDSTYLITKPCQVSGSGERSGGLLGKRSKQTFDCQILEDGKIILKMGSWCIFGHRVCRFYARSSGASIGFGVRFGVFEYVLTPSLNSGVLQFNTFETRAFSSLATSGIKLPDSPLVPKLTVTLLPKADVPEEINFEAKITRGASTVSSLWGEFRPATSNLPVLATPRGILPALIGERAVDVTRAYWELSFAAVVYFACVVTVLWLIKSYRESTLLAKVAPLAGLATSLKDLAFPLRLLAEPNERSAPMTASREEKMIKQAFGSSSGIPTAEELRDIHKSATPQPSSHALDVSTSRLPAWTMPAPTVLKTP